ncbi:MAG: ParA family protein [Gammaproteobacteria bacterium]|nr:ParA family protein [Gammaproteobacteria bacterium]
MKRAASTRKIAVVNPKGGCGKTTIATSLAAWLAYEADVALADLDVQQSSAEWHSLRLADNPYIELLAARRWPPAVPAHCDYLIIDSPAAINARELERLLAYCDKIIVPLLPSPIDMRSGWRYLDQLFRLRKASRSQCEIGLIANRVKSWTIIYRELIGFIDQFKAPFVGHLRESVNYIRAMEAGLGVAELPYYQCRQDWSEWHPLVDWVKH